LSRTLPSSKQPSSTMPDRSFTLHLLRQAAASPKLLGAPVQGRGEAPSFAQGGVDWPSQAPRSSSVLGCHSTTTETNPV
ncbi:MAG TPA: hypothetical protein VGP82_23165, partial [Ktedonobacterales bacterium]|nr:hypothetical protein [Ktedonobacterales bacterium]